jgi:hypothetical protein
MQQSPLAAPTNASHGESAGTSPRDDVVGGLSWMLLGIVILVASWRMDRLEAQDINPYTIPGLVPGLLGLGMMFFAALMLARGWRHGGLRTAAPMPDERKTAYGRLALALVLCLGYAVVLLGRVPFWLAASLFVSISIFVLRFTELRAKAQLVRGAVTSTAIGIGSGALVTLVFEKLFLVRLP